MADFDPKALTKDFEPKRAVIDGQEYNYKRVLLEVLECQTCKTYFVTHITTGVGTIMTEREDSEFCAGCMELCKSVDILEDNGAKPS
jgi:hypothetical protein